MGSRATRGTILVFVAAFLWAPVITFENVYLPFLEGLYFHTDIDCMDTLHYMSSDPEDLAFHLEHNLDSDGLRTVLVPVLNRTIVTTRPYRRREFVCEYSGEHIDEKEMDQRRSAAPGDHFGYMLLFENIADREQMYIIVDAKGESDSRGRLINHSYKRGNVYVFPVRYRGHPRLIFLALRDITAGEELLWDYGYKSMDPEVVRRFPWLKE